MRFTEIANPEEQLALWKMVSDTMWATFGKQDQKHQKLVSPQLLATSASKAAPSAISRNPPESTGKSKGASDRARKTKKLPMTPAPKPLPKTKPQKLTPSQISKQQSLQHQQLAKHINQAILSKPAPKAHPRSSPATEPIPNYEQPMNAGYSERDKDELVFHSRSNNPLKPLNVKNR